MSESSEVSTKVKRSNPWHINRRKKKKRKKRNALFTKKKSRTTTANIRVPAKQRRKIYRDRNRLKKVLNSKGHNIDNLPFINYKNPLILPHTNTCKNCKKQFKSHKDLISHFISNNGNNKCTHQMIENTKTHINKINKYPLNISNYSNTKSINICNYCNKQFNTKENLLSHILSSQRYNGKCIEREMEKEIKPETKEYSHLNLNAFAQFERKELLRRLLIMEQKENEEIDKYINNNSN
eukprot:472194_1